MIPAGFASAYPTTETSVLATKYNVSETKIRRWAMTLGVKKCRKFVGECVTKRNTGKLLPMKRKRNSIDILEDCALVRLTRGYVAVIDLFDVELVSRHKWHAQVLPNGIVYARSNIVIEGKIQQINLHRFLMGNPPGMEVDHADRDTMNHRRSNLRLCTHSQNLCNVGLSKRNTNGLKGVTKLKTCDRWMARFRAKYIGLFSTAEEAALAYNMEAEKQAGAFAWKNVI